MSILFAEVILSAEALVIVGALVAALTGAVTMLFKQLIASKDAQLAQAVAAYVEQLKSYKEIAREATANLTVVAVAKAKQEGREKPAPVAPVVPEHNSPPTEEQKAAAELQTLRAELVAATLELGLPARKEEAQPADDTTATVVAVEKGEGAGPLSVVVNPEGGGPPVTIHADAVTITADTNKPEGEPKP